MNTEGPFRIEFEISFCAMHCVLVLRTMMIVKENTITKAIYQLLKCASGLMMLI